MFTSKDYIPPARKVPFIRINGRLVRDTRGREVSINAGAKGNSLSKFPRSLGSIGYHKWS